MVRWYQVLDDVRPVVSMLLHGLEYVHFLVKFHLLPHAADGGIEPTLAYTIAVGTHITST